MIKYLKKHPLASSLIVVGLYAVWFIAPALIKGIPADAKGLTDIDAALNMFGSELITAVILAGIITVLGWWREMGFTRMKEGSFKFILPIILLILLLLNIAWLIDHSNKWFLGFDSPWQLGKMILVILLLGFVEEGVFRGVFLYGLLSRFTPLWSVIIAAVTFGSFHFFNIFVGADPLDALSQVIHAAAMGFLYGALRLRIGAIWPLMLLHGFWDFSLFILSTLTPYKEEAVQNGGPVIGIVIALPALLYGIFVYWRYSKLP